MPSTAVVLLPPSSRQIIDGLHLGGENQQSFLGTKISGNMPMHTTEKVDMAKCKNLTAAASGRVIFTSTDGPPNRYINPPFVPVERIMSCEYFGRHKKSLPTANKPAIGSIARAVTSTGISNNRKAPGLQSASSRRSCERSVSPGSLCLRNIVCGER